MGMEIGWAWMDSKGWMDLDLDGASEIAWYLPFAILALVVLGIEQGPAVGPNVGTASLTEAGIDSNFSLQSSLITFK
jgi:hypothetical protein